MLSWLKLHFIPHHANNHRPHILHARNVHGLIGFALFLEIFVFLIPTIAFVGKASSTTILPSVLSTLTNEQRQEQHLPELAVNETLNKAAQEKADDMATKGYFAHTSPEGKTPWYWLDDVGYAYQYAGENLAVNFTDSHDVTKAWMESPTHRANIVKANYTEVGTGVATGLYEGNEAVFVAQVYGSPRKLATAVPRTVTALPKPAEEPVVENGPVAQSDATVQATEVLGAESEAQVAPVAAEEMPVYENTAPAPKVSLTDRVAVSPRTTTNILLFAIIAIVALALFLNVGIRVSHHHPDLIMNGVMAIAVIGGIFVSNNYISKSGTTVANSIDYQYEEKSYVY